MLRVLIIDDDALSRESLTILLTRAGYVVISEQTGARIETLVASGRFDALLTDLYMPEIDGLETLARAKRVAPRLPVIGMAHHVTGDDPCPRAMKLLGAADVIAKPIDEAQVLAALATAIAECVALC